MDGYTRRPCLQMKIAANSFEELSWNRQGNRQRQHSACWGMQLRRHKIRRSGASEKKVSAASLEKEKINHEFAELTAASLLHRATT